MAETTCAMCGFRFDPDANRSCAACPLQSGCQLACCPNCGFEVVDPNQSVLARTVARIFKKSSKEKPSMPTLNSSQEKESHRNPAGQRLTELPPGTHARMVSFAPGIPGDRKAQLQAYGVIPGNSLWIRQQKPVTVIQVDHTELAFESELAESIYLEKL